MSRYILIPLLCFALLSAGGAAAQSAPPALPEAQAAPAIPAPAAYLWSGASFRYVVHEGFLRPT